jgi:hypothetical protein
MATAFLSRALQRYNARVNPYVISATIPAGLQNPVRGVRVTVGHPEGEPWPEGPVAEVLFTSPDGRVQGFNFSGGQLIFRGKVLNTRSCTWEIEQGDPFLIGEHSLSFKVLQTVSATLLIERL